MVERGSVCRRNEPYNICKRRISISDNVAPIGKSAGKDLAARGALALGG